MAFWIHLDICDFGIQKSHCKNSVSTHISKKTCFHEFFLRKHKEKCGAVTERKIKNTIN